MEPSKGNPCQTLSSCEVPCASTAAVISFPPTLQPHFSVAQDPAYLAPPSQARTQILHPLAESLFSDRELSPKRSRTLQPHQCLLDRFLYPRSVRLLLLFKKYRRRQTRVKCSMYSLLMRFERDDRGRHRRRHNIRGRLARQIYGVHRPLQRRKVGGVIPWDIDMHLVQRDIYNHLRS